jgi:signal transduction histidine kinase
MVTPGREAAGHNGRVSWGARVAAAAALGVAAVAETLLRAGSAHGLSFVVLMCVLALATTLPLAAGRPVVGGLIAAVAAVLSIVPFESLTVAGVVGTVATVYRVGREGNVLASGLSIPFVVAALIDAVDAGASLTAVLLVSGTPAAAGIGLLQHSREQSRAYSAAREELAGSMVEHLARGERARIARELHDVVAHHISMVVVQAESARVTTPGLPSAAAQRLVEIRDTARAGLTEMRRLLGVLREDPDTDPPDRHPQPGLPQLHELLDDARAASGAATRLIVSGAPVALDPGVELAAYRIVQEALTNARRHAPGAAVDVELRYTDDALSVRVRDNGPGPPRAGTGEGAGGDGAGEVTAGHGHGLQGMRERAVAVGGRLQAGPSSLGGFLLEATLPAKAEAPP